MNEKSFKLREIIERARLADSTAQYILKHPDVLTGMPEGGKQGVHRVFKLDQAFRFALCCQLVQAGVPLRNATKIVQSCFDAERKHSGTRQKASSLFRVANWNKRWTGLVADGRFFQLQYGGEPVKIDGAHWYSIESDGPASYESHRSVTTATIDLTKLAVFLDM